MYCRGHNLRIQIVEQFDTKPLGRFKLLNGQSVISDAGKMDIVDEDITFQSILETLNKNNELCKFKYDLILEYLDKLKVEQHFY